ncbi:MAG: hypothetical protein Kow0047_03810 [Anaerolineae bacterium]
MLSVICLLLSVAALVMSGYYWRQAQELRRLLESQGAMAAALWDSEVAELTEEISRTATEAVIHVRRRHDELVAVVERAERIQRLLDETATALSRDLIPGLRRRGSPPAAFGPSQLGLQCDVSLREVTLSTWGAADSEASLTSSMNTVVKERANGSGLRVS